MGYKRKTIPGFTLIEVLVSCTLILLMAAVAIPAYSRYNAVSTFNYTVDEVVSNINLAISSAKYPDQSVKSYIIEPVVTNKTIKFVKHKDTSSENYKSLIMADAIESIEYANAALNDLIVFPVEQNIACNSDKAAPPTDPYATVFCSSTSAFSGDFLVIHGKYGLSKTIKIQSNSNRVLAY